MKKILAVVVVIIAIIIGLTRAPSESVTLGLMLPLSGEYAVAGQNYQKGVELALEKYKNVKLVVEDDGFDVKKGISAYQKLVEVDKIDALMMLSTPVVDALHEDMVKDGIPVMQLGIQTAGVKKDNILQMSPSGEAPLREFAKYVKGLNYKKVAVVYDNTAAGLNFYNAFAEGFGKADAFIVNTRNDIRGHAIKIVGENYDAVIFLTSPENGAITVKEILTIDQTPPFFGFDAQLQTGFADYARILGDANKLNGSKSLWLKSGDAKEFQKLFKDKHGTEPGFIADFGYDIMNVLMGNYDSDSKEWVGKMENITTDGASGPISFDELGVRIQPIVINEVISGKLVQSYSK